VTQFFRLAFAVDLEQTVKKTVGDLKLLDDPSETSVLSGPRLRHRLAAGNSEDIMGEYSNTPLYPLLRTPDIYEKIGQLASGGWLVAAAASSALGSLEMATAVATRTGVSALSASARLSIYTLPIAAFLFGASARKRIEDKEEQIKASVWLIMKLAWYDALARHSKIFPRSMIIDPSQPMGVIVSTDIKYKTAYSVLSNIQISSRARLEREAHLASAPVPLPQTVYNGKVVGAWESFVLSNFDDVRARDSQAFLLLEAAARK
jgi:hypothetical protein